MSLLRNKNKMHLYSTILIVPNPNPPCPSPNRCHSTRLASVVAPRPSTPSPIVHLLLLLHPFLAEVHTRWPRMHTTVFYNCEALPILAPYWALVGRRAALSNPYGEQTQGWQAQIGDCCTRSMPRRLSQPGLRVGSCSRPVCVSACLRVRIFSFPLPIPLASHAARTGLDPSEPGPPGTWYLMRYAACGQHGG